MSTEICRTGGISVTRFYAGASVGVAYQITLANGAHQVITRDEMRDLIKTVGDSMSRDDLIKRMRSEAAELEDEGIIRIGRTPWALLREAADLIERGAS